jgi:hypothetical protein
MALRPAEADAAGVHGQRARAELAQVLVVHRELLRPE